MTYASSLSGCLAGLAKQLRASAEGRGACNTVCGSRRGRGKAMCCCRASGQPQSSAACSVAALGLAHRISQISCTALRLTPALLKSRQVFTGSLDYMAPKPLRPTSVTVPWPGHWHLHLGSPYFQVLQRTDAHPVHLPYNW